MGSYSSTVFCHTHIYVEEGVHVAQWAKRPPLKVRLRKRPSLKQKVPGSNPNGWVNGRDGNRDPFRWLETAQGLSPIRLIGRAQYFPGGLAVSSLKGVHIASFLCLSKETLSFFMCFAYRRTPHVVTDSNSSRSRSLSVAREQRVDVVNMPCSII